VNNFFEKVIHRLFTGYSQVIHNTIVYGSPSYFYGKKNLKEIEKRIK